MGASHARLRRGTLSPSLPLRRCALPTRLAISPFAGAHRVEAFAVGRGEEVIIERDECAAAWLLADRYERGGELECIRGSQSMHAQQTLGPLSNGRQSVNLRPAFRESHESVLRSRQIVLRQGALSSQPFQRG
jgi:hypothetical protein